MRVWMGNVYLLALGQGYWPLSRAVLATMHGPRLPKDASGADRHVIAEANAPSRIIIKDVFYLRFHTLRISRPINFRKVPECYLERTFAFSASSHILNSIYTYPAKISSKTR